mmetsp:Transcript_26375/g.55594  ORF Transcript_26375/g.55594 Transcript_26375/m.55594 type:complete len:409 (+) Transcript_26375:133-1359(+)
MTTASIFSLTAGMIALSTIYASISVHAFLPGFRSTSRHAAFHKGVRNFPSVVNSDFLPSSNRATFTATITANPKQSSPRFLSSTTNENNNDASQELPRPSEMKLREIQSELKQRRVSYADCFDRDSLTKRLEEARESNPIVAEDGHDGKETEGGGKGEEGKEPESTIDVAETARGANGDGQNDSEQSTSSNTSKTTSTTTETKTQSQTQDFDRQTTLQNLRTLKIKDLRTQLSQNNVRWGNIIEKEELVQALCNVMERKFEASKNFSRSGEIMPGKVTDVDDAVLLRELGWRPSGNARDAPAVDAANTGEKGTPQHAPILLDVYATWCGPCQFLVPQLQSAAEEFGPDVRVMKLDSDKYPGLAGQLKVAGLPTLILFDGGEESRELKRMEGALTKDGIVEFVKKNVSA